LRKRGGGIPPELVERFGLGFCARGSMAGRVAIPIENVEGELVAYAGRWVGTDAELPAGEEKYKLPKGFQKSLELWNLHRVKPYWHLIVVEVTRPPMQGQALGESVSFG
jgi:DNA primase